MQTTFHFKNSLNLELNSQYSLTEETFKMQYEVITFFESHYVLVLMIAMHWKVVVWLKSCRYTLTRDPAIGGRVGGREYRLDGPSKGVGEPFDVCGVYFIYCDLTEYFEIH